MDVSGVDVLGVDRFAKDDRSGSSDRSSLRFTRDFLNSLPNDFFFAVDGIPSWLFWTLSGLGTDNLAVEGFSSCA